MKVLAIITKILICLQDIYQGVHSFHTLQLHHSTLHSQIDIHNFNNTFNHIITIQTDNVSTPFLMEIVTPRIGHV